MKIERKMNERGFSLVELMIVVAIIGILSAIAIPNFQRYQQKARQSEAKNNLAALYSAEKASYAEFGVYAGNFVAIGFRPEGLLKYRITATDNSGAINPAPVPNQAACISTAVTTCAYSAAAPNSPWKEDAQFAMAPAGTCAAATANNTFTACAGSNIGQTGTSDTWKIDETNSLTNPTSGMN